MAIKNSDGAKDGARRYLTNKFSADDIEIESVNFDGTSYKQGL